MFTQNAPTFRIHYFALALLIAFSVLATQAVAAESTAGKTQTQKAAVPKSRVDLRKTPVRPAPATGVNPESSAVLRPATKGPSAGIAGTTNPGLGRAAVDANAVRGLRDLKEIGSGLRGVAQTDGNRLTPANTDLTKARESGGRFGQMPMPNQDDSGAAKMPAGMPAAPSLPSNSAKRPGSVVGAPSHNLRHHMGGSASSDGSHGRVVGHESDSGTVPESGTVYSRNTFLYEDGYTVTEVVSQHRDGGSTVQTVRTDVENNTMTTETVHRDRDGNVTDKSTSVAEADPRTGEGDIAGTQDPNADRHDGSVCRAMPWTCRGAPAKNVTQVNPGNERGGFAQAPRIKPGRDIVVNPATDNLRQANQARGLDREAARRAIDDGALVNPPNPND